MAQRRVRPARHNISRPSREIGVSSAGSQTGRLNFLRVTLDKPIDGSNPSSPRFLASVLRTLISRSFPRWTNASCARPRARPASRLGARRRSAPEGWSDRRMVDRYVRPLLLEIERGHWHDAPVWLGPRASGPTPRTIAVPRHQQVAGPTITAEPPVASANVL